MTYEKRSAPSVDSEARIDRYREPSATYLCAVPGIHAVSQIEALKRMYVCRKPAPSSQLAFIIRLLTFL